MTLATRLNRGSVDPFVSLGLDSFVRQVFGPENARPQSNAPYGVDVYEDVEHLHLDAELPGFTREQIDITIDDGVLTITAERPAPAVKNDVPEGANAEVPQPTWHVRERRSARVKRSFGLPKTIDAAATIDAKLADGVLHLTLSKRPELKPRKIAIA